MISHKHILLRGRTIQGGGSSQILEFSVPRSVSSTVSRRARKGILFWYWLLVRVLLVRAVPIDPPFSAPRAGLVGFAVQVGAKKKVLVIIPCAVGEWKLSNEIGSY